MHVRVLLFATYREIVGDPEIRWSIPDRSSLAEFLESFLAAHPKLVPHRKSMMLAVNETYVGPETILRDGDEVALLPPVSGGIM